MTRPGRYLVWMGAGVVAAALLGVFLLPRLAEAFFYNPALNGGIVVVLLIGICFTFWQVIRLYREIDWLEKFREGRHETVSPGPRLLAPMAAMLGERRG